MLSRVKPKDFLYVKPFCGWVSIGKSKLDGAQMHFNVRAQPDLRYVFQFDGEIRSSPQVLQSEESFQRVQRSLNHYDSK